jgi:hypothetical protein
MEEEEEEEEEKIQQWQQLNRSTVSAVNLKVTYELLYRRFNRG